LRDSHTFTIKQGRRNLRLLRSAVIYGANASGKSNIINALQTMWKIILQSAKSQRGDEIPIEPFAFNPENSVQPTEFDITFILDNLRFQYGFAVTKKQVVEEWLYTFDKKDEPITWFERELDVETGHYNWLDDNILPSEKIFWQKSTRDNELFLAKAVQMNADILQGVFDYFEGKRFGIVNIVEDLYLNTFTQYMCETNESIKIKTIKFLKFADNSIFDIEIKSNKVSSLFNEAKVIDNFFVKENAIKKLMEGGFLDEIMIGRKINGHIYYLPLASESLGTKKIFIIAAGFISALDCSDILIIDELNTHLHPLLTDYLIQQFNNPITNPNNAQLIFTTHDVSVLTNKNFRKDQVWFVRKTEQLNSELYSLAEFKDISRNEKYANNYLLGRYDGIPYLPQLPNQEKK
jgi:hypothetical protein